MCLQSDNTHWWIEKLLQFIVQPHLDCKALPDEAHLMWSILGSEKLLSSLLNLALLCKIDAEALSTRRPFTVVHGFNTAVHNLALWRCGECLACLECGEEIRFIYNLFCNWKVCDFTLKSLRANFCFDILKLLVVGTLYHLQLKYVFLFFANNPSLM